MLQDDRPKRTMIESEALAWISAYMAKNKIRANLKVEDHQKMVVEAKTVQTVETLETGQNGETTSSESCRLDYMYDDKPLGFEKYLMTSTKRMEALDPLEEIDLGDETTRRPTYISAKIDPSLRTQIIKLFKEFKDSFIWNYDEMLGLIHNFVELKIMIWPDKKPIKQIPRRCTPKVMSKIKTDIERLLKTKFIRNATYVEWLENIIM